MLKALNTAATGMQAQQENMEVISNNMSNASTTGFKKARAEFEDLLYQTVKEPGAATGLNAVSPTGVQTGLGVKTSAVQRDHAAGAARITDNPFDLMIEGKGFFQVQNENGDIMYTRNGEFKRNNEGLLVDKNGNTLYPEVKVPEDANVIEFTSKGLIVLNRDRISTPEVIGQMQLATFINPAGLKALGKNNFTSTPASGEPQTGKPGEGHFGAVAQGQLESSNVNIVEEMVNMINSQRTFETNSKAMQAADQMLQTINNIR
ncbi:MAG: flagellar basal-body rod protein FlgG [Bdellovibrionales bacterium]|nr:flagellar basal-body rod protein FlgG [Bdellovibrionales bacterium]NQZ18508.1 flagellar basal-body rod protein FlgG [Bdellovibrionales bacterium]